MVRDLLEQLEWSYGEFHVLNIMESNEYIAIEFSDIYGKISSRYIIIWDKNTGNKIDKTIEELNCDWERFSIPEKFQTYFGKILEEIPNYIDPIMSENLGQRGLYIVLSVLWIYEEKNLNKIAISELFALCRYTIYLIFYNCSEAEKRDSRAISKNKTVRKFLVSSLDKKLKSLSINDYYIPQYISTVEFLEAEIEMMVSSKANIDASEFKEIKKNMLNTCTYAINSLENDTNIFCNKGMLEAKLNASIQKVVGELTDLEKQINSEQSRNKLKNANAKNKMKFDVQDAIKKTEGTEDDCNNIFRNRFRDLSDTQENKKCIVIDMFTKQKIDTN